VTISSAEGSSSALCRRMLSDEMVLLI
jgi:hypothetical protein